MKQPIVISDFMEPEHADTLFENVLDLPDDQFDTLDNPFEHKRILCHKLQLPAHLEYAFNILNWQVSRAQDLCGKLVQPEKDRYYWGIHEFQCGDFLRAHLDANTHPYSGLAKEATALLYLSKNWDSSYGGALEFYHENKPWLSIQPKHGSLVLFECSEDSWHGVSPCVFAPPNAVRIVLTVSFMYPEPRRPQRKKALFWSLNNDEAAIAALRTDPERCEEVYRMGQPEVTNVGVGG